LSFTVSSLNDGRSLGSIPQHHNITLSYKSWRVWVVRTTQ
jgi:hypothetical protein